MLTAVVRKSVTDLSRRRARTTFSVLTLAIAVASISFLSIPPLIDHAMQGEVRAGRLADVSLAMRPVDLTDRQLADIAALPNVAAVEARSSVDVRVLIGERRAPARVIGVRDFGRQSVDIVRVDSGVFPVRAQLLADVQDANVGVYDGRAGDVLTVLGAGDEHTPFTISGRGRTLPGGEQVQNDKVIVLYAPAATVAGLSGEPGYGDLALRLHNPSESAARATVEVVRQYLTTVPGFTGFANLPAVRAPGDWPGKADTEQFAKLLVVITVLALLSAVVLIANTMSTLIAEQTHEIAIMRALGARRRTIAMVYARTTLMLGTLGALIGSGLGIALSNLLARYFGATFWAVEVGFGIDVGVLVTSILIGLLAPPLAALPAIRRAARIDLRDALEASSSGPTTRDAGERVLRLAGVLPRVMQIGLRNLGRRKRRSLATASMVALAVGNLIAVLAMSEAATRTTRAAWGDHLEDVQVSTAGRALFDARAADEIRSTPGVVDVQPVLKNTVELAGRQAFVWAVQPDPLFHYRLTDGRWFNPAEEQAAERVAVIERNIAQLAGVTTGDQVTLTTAAGPATFRVIGMASNQQENGTALFVPLSTARALLGQPDGATAFWVKTARPDHGLVDHTTSLVEDRLAALGYEVTSEIRYVAERDEVAANSSLTTTIAVLGFLIIAMSMIGLANAITANVLERTREIGILRSIGARARDIRRIFTTEGVALALTGWLLGVPVGYLLSRVLVWLVWNIVEVRLPAVFPPWNIVIALTGTVVVALAVLFLPVRRAVRFRPGEALRYA